MSNALFVINLNELIAGFKFEHLQFGAFALSAFMPTSYV